METKNKNTETQDVSEENPLSAVLKLAGDVSAARKRGIDMQRAAVIDSPGRRLIKLCTFKPNHEPISTDQLLKLHFWRCKSIVCA